MKYAVTLLLLSVLPSAAYAELEVTRPMHTWCKAADTEHFLWAFHPGEKSRKKVYEGSLNERTPGFGLSCYFSPPSGGSAYAHAGELINSQVGEATLLGVGYYLPLVTVERVTLGVRAEVDHIEYGVPRKHAVKRGYLPIAALDLRYEFFPGWSIGPRQYFLPKGRITMTAVFLQVEF